MSHDRTPDQQPIRDRDMRTGQAAAAARIHHQASWVDQQIRVAMERGDFDDLPGAGKPIKDLDGHHDPDWWLKQLVEREHIAVLPPSLQLRKDDAELDAKLDGIGYEAEARREVEEFNERVIKARYSLQAGPPLITMPRDVEPTLEAWRERRETRRRENAESLRRQREDTAVAGGGRTPKRRWWRRADRAS